MAATRTQPRLSDEDAAAMRREYEAGGTVEGLAARWGWDKNTVIAGIKRAGGNIRRVGRPTRLPVAPGDLLALNEHGMTRRQLAALCEAPIGTIDGALSRARRARPLL